MGIPALPWQPRVWTHMVATMAGTGPLPVAWQGQQLPLLRQDVQSPLPKVAGVSLGTQVQDDIQEPNPQPTEDFLCF